jgi:hypothetical protein
MLLTGIANIIERAFGTNWVLCVNYDEGGVRTDTTGSKMADTMRWAGWTPPPRCSQRWTDF